MNQFFDQAFAYLLHDEGVVYTNDPRDAGGPTKFGITQKTYESYVGHLVLLNEIKEMSVETAKQVYTSLYWVPLSCDKMTLFPVATAIFDTGALYGIGVAATTAQRAINTCQQDATVAIDGHIGAATLSYLNANDPKPFIVAYHSLVLDRIDVVIENNPKDEIFRKGWTARADRLLTLLDVGAVIE